MPAYKNYVLTGRSVNPLGNIKKLHTYMDHSWEVARRKAHQLLIEKHKKYTVQRINVGNVEVYNVLDNMSYELLYTYVLRDI